MALSSEELAGRSDALATMDSLSSPSLTIALSSRGHQTATSYVSSRLGPSLHPTMYGDSTEGHSHDSLTHTSITSVDENLSDPLHGRNIEIGSAHASSSMHSVDMAGVWSDPV